MPSVLNGGGGTTKTQCETDFQTLYLHKHTLLVLHLKPEDVIRMLSFLIICYACRKDRVYVPCLNHRWSFFWQCQVALATKMSHPPTSNLHTNNSKLQ